MGEPKLLLPWKTGTVIEQVLATWQASSVNRILVVLRQDQQPLIRICERWGVEVVVPEEPPAEMKRSVQAALGHIKQRYQPADEDVFLLAPADMPRLPTELIDRLLVMHQLRDPRIVVPVFRGRRGHPVLIPWGLSTEVLTLGPEQGVNSLLERNRLRTLQVDDSACLQDLDNPVDYRPPVD
jgi:molybdenum cofactor cytidylyltransferase